MKPDFTDHTAHLRRQDRNIRNVRFHRKSFSEKERVEGLLLKMLKFPTLTD